MTVGLTRFAPRVEGPAWAALLISIVSLPAWAADAADTNTPEADTLQANTLQEVVVTASKRATNLMETPIAISALTQDALEREGVKTARDLAGLVPNLQLATGADSGTAITIRGITSTDFTEVGEGAVALHQDGFYSPRSQGALALMYDLDRVEVLRGPQGTLFGMNASAGAINIIPTAPRFDRWVAQVDGTLGNYNHGEVRGMVNLPITSNFALRGAFMIDRHDGMLTQEKDTRDFSYAANDVLADGIPDVDQRRNADVPRRNWYNNSKQQAGRIIGLWEPLDVLAITGTVSRFVDDGAGDIDFIDCDQVAGTINACDHPLRWASINVPGKKHLTIDDYQLKVAAQMTERSAIEYRTSYQDQKRRQIEDVDGGTAPNPLWSSIGPPQTPEAELTGYYATWDESWNTRHSNYRSTTHELQFKSTGEGKFQYVAGAFYLRENKQIRYDMEMLTNKTFHEDESQPLGYIPDGLPDTWIFDQQKRMTTSKAGFAQVDYRVVPKVNLTAGYRYSKDSKSDNNGITYAFWQGSESWYNGQYTPTGYRAHQSSDLTWDMGGNAPLGTVMPASEPNNVSMGWSQGTYRLGAQFFPRENRMLFASVATGYRMGGMYEKFDFCNNGCLNLLTYDPEHVKTYEVGYKATLLDDHLQLSATAFYSDYTDMQSTGDKVVGVDQNPESPNFGEPVTAWTTDNLSSSRIKGLELEFDLIPWRDGRFSGYAAWLDTAISDAGSFTDGYACAEREIYGQPLCGDPSVSNVVGNQLPFSPKYALNFNYQHHINLASSYALEPRVALRWQSKMWFDILNYDGPHLSQAQDAYTKIDLSLRLNGPDDRFYSELFIENATDEDTKSFFGFNRGFVKGYYDPPRTYGLRAGYSFGR